MTSTGVVLTVFFAFIAAEAPSPEHPAANVFTQTAREADQARAANRLPDAIHSYSEAVRMRPSWSEGWWSLGALYYDEDRFEEARTAFARFVSLAPDPTPALGLLGLCEYETHDYDRALGHFVAWAEKRPPASNELLAVAYFHWSLLLIRSARFERATVLLNSRAKLGNSGPALEEAMGLAALRIARLPEDYPSAEREPVYLAGKAQMQLALGHIDRAEGNGRKLLLHYDRHPNVHYFLGTILLDAPDNEAAAKEFQRELEISPGHLPAMVQLALHHLKVGEPDQALPLAERAVAIDPHNFPAHKAFGDALLGLERYQESVRELEIARGLAPESATVRFALARAYAGLGRPDDARREREAFYRLKEREQERVSK